MFFTINIYFTWKHLDGLTREDFRQLPLKREFLWQVFVNVTGFLGFNILEKRSWMGLGSRTFPQIKVAYFTKNRLNIQDSGEKPARAWIQELFAIILNLKFRNMCLQFLLGGCACAPFGFRRVCTQYLYIYICICGNPALPLRKWLQNVKNSL